MTKCVICGGKLKKTKTFFDYREGKNLSVITGVPAEICSQCGEKTYSPEVTAAILSLIKNRVKPVRTVRVPVWQMVPKMIGAEK